MKGAFEYACKIWEEQIPTALPIRITAKVGYLFSSSNPVSEVTVRGEFDNNYNELVLNTRLKGLYFGERDSPVSFVDYATVDLLEGGDGVITYNKSRINEFSFSLDPQPTDKYDFVTVALRDMAKLLGFYWGKQAEPTTQTLDLQGARLTPFEKIIAESIGTSDIHEAYVRVTQGVLNVNIPVWDYGRIQFYAPNPWIKGTSLNYCIPDSTKRLTELLSYEIGRGSVIRNITDDYANLFQQALRWQPSLAVGGGGGGGEVSSSTENIIPYQGSLEINGLSQSLSLLSDGDRGVSALAENYSNDQRTWYFISEYCLPYHPNLSVDGDTGKAGWNVSFLKKDGTWDVLDELRSEGEYPLYLNTKMLDFKNVDNYARTYDGYLKCRISLYKNEWYFNHWVLRGSSKYYVLNFLPQKPKMQFVNVMPTTYSLIDDYARTIKIAINDLEGTNKIIVEQLDEGETYPQKYEITDFKKGYYTAIVDKEFSSQFTIIAYNDNGNVRSETLTVEPLEPARYHIDPSVYGDFIKIASDDMRFRETLVASYTIYAINEYSAQRDVTTNTTLESDKIDISKLNKGLYILSLHDVYNKTYSLKFMKK